MVHEFRLTTAGNEPPVSHADHCLSFHSVHNKNGGSTIINLPFSDEKINVDKLFAQVDTSA